MQICWSWCCRSRPTLAPTRSTEAGLAGQLYVQLVAGPAGAQGQHRCLEVSTAPHSGEKLVDHRVLALVEGGVAEFGPLGDKTLGEQVGQLWAHLAGEGDVLLHHDGAAARLRLDDEPGVGVHRPRLRHGDEGQLHHLARRHAAGEAQAGAVAHQGAVERCEGPRRAAAQGVEAGGRLAAAVPGTQLHRAVGAEITQLAGQAAVDEDQAGARQTAGGEMLAHRLRGGGIELRLADHTVLGHRPQVGERGVSPVGVARRRPA